MNESVSLYTIMNDVELIKRFVKEIQKCKNDVNITSADNRFTVDAKSIMSVLSLDTSRPICITFMSKADYESMEPFIYDNCKTIVVCAC